MPYPPTALIAFPAFTQRSSVYEIGLMDERSGLYENCMTTRAFTGGYRTGT